MFSYDSLSGNGMLGVGWSLMGLSAVSLCAKTLAQDGRLDRFPGFCLDGQRLIPVAYASGRTEWRTEFESFARVFTSGNFLAPDGDMTPSVFTVQRKDGTTWTYGSDDSSKLYGTVTLGEYYHTTTRHWGVSEIRDRAGNRIAIRYSSLPTVRRADGATEITPRWIGYNFVDDLEDNAINEVVFEYDSDTRRGVERPELHRPDVLYGYAFGHGVQQTRRLKTVKIVAQGCSVARPMAGIGVVRCRQLGAAGLVR